MDFDPWVETVEPFRTMLVVMHLSVQHFNEGVRASFFQPVRSTNLTELTAALSAFEAMPRDSLSGAEETFTALLQPPVFPHFTIPSSFAWQIIEVVRNGVDIRDTLIEPGSNPPRPRGHSSLMGEEEEDVHDSDIVLVGETKASLPPRKSKKKTGPKAGKGKKKAIVLDSSDEEYEEEEDEMETSGDDDAPSELGRTRSASRAKGVTKPATKKKPAASKKAAPSLVIKTEKVLPSATKKRTAAPTPSPEAEAPPAKRTRAQGPAAAASAKAKSKPKARPSAAALAAQAKKTAAEAAATAAVVPSTRAYYLLPSTDGHVKLSPAVPVAHAPDASLPASPVGHAPVVLPPIESIVEDGAPPLPTLGQVAAATDPPASVDSGDEDADNAPQPGDEYTDDPWAMLAHMHKAGADYLVGRFDVRLGFPQVPEPMNPQMFNLGVRKGKFPPSRDPVSNRFPLLSSFPLTPSSGPA